jgi:hypothetical protein
MPDMRGLGMVWPMRWLRDSPAYRYRMRHVRRIRSMPGLPWNWKGIVMRTTDSTQHLAPKNLGVAMDKQTVKRTNSGVTRLVRRLERERRRYVHAAGEEVPTAQAWRAGVAEGIRLAQLAIRKGV